MAMEPVEQRGKAPVVVRLHGGCEVGRGMGREGCEDRDTEQRSKTHGGLSRVDDSV
jgi:poly(3-hydroxybutyrate) depolymerase